MIRTEQLTRRFGAVTAVDHLTVEVARGEVFGLVGPDGAGKTTTLRMLAGLLDASEGQAFVAGHDVARETNAVKDRIGYMAQRFGLYGDLTVEENMRFYGDLFGVPESERSELNARLLRITRMDPFRDRAAAKLSGGMKQKLALICTLLHHPEVLFLDEPTNGVDPVSRRDFWEILYQLVAQGLTVFVTTAYLDEAERCHRVGLMDRGRLFRLDTPERLRHSLDKEEFCCELRCPEPRAAREAAAAMPGVTGAETAGASVHLFARRGETDPGRIAAALDGRGLGPVEAREITPSLEDIFIALLRRAEAA